MVPATLGKNLQHPVPKWSDALLLIRKPMAVDNMAFCSEVDILSVVPAHVVP